MTDLNVKNILRFLSGIVRLIELIKTNRLEWMINVYFRILTVDLISISVRYSTRSWRRELYQILRIQLNGKLASSLMMFNTSGDRIQMPNLQFR